MKPRHLIVVFLGCGLVPLMAQRAPIQDTGREERARLQYQSGITNLEEGLPTEALNDFRAITQLYPDTRVAADAWLQIGLQFERTREWDKAVEATKALLTKHPDSSAAAHGHVLDGRLLLAKSLTPDDIRSALAAFGRVSIMFPRSDAVPEAEFYSGEAHRLDGAWQDALEHYRLVVSAYSRSPWAARARLGTSWCLLRLGRPVDAMVEAQLVRLKFPALPEAERAREWNTILHRLYVSGLEAAPYSPAGPLVQAKLDDVSTLVVGPDNTLYVALKTGVLAYKDAKGPATSVYQGSPQAMGLGVFGDLIVAGADGLVGATNGKGFRPLLPPSKPGEKPRTLEEITGVVSIAAGQYLVASDDRRAVYRFGANGSYLGPLGSEPAPQRLWRLLLAGPTRIVWLDRDSREVFIAGQDGKVVARVPSRGAGFEMREPADVAVDVLGHVYALDRAQGDVFVFGPSGTGLLAKVHLEHEKRTVRGRALAVDNAGRLLVFDERSRQILQYR